MTRSSRAGGAIRLVTRLLTAAYLIEAGVLLTVAPWTLLWDRNYFGDSVAGVAALLASPFVRGGVSGIGVVTLVAGLRDLAGIFGRPSPPASDPVGLPPQL